MDSFRPSSCLSFTIHNWNLNATVWTNGSNGQLTQNHLTDCERIFAHVDSLLTQQCWFLLLKLQNVIKATVKNNFLMSKIIVCNYILEQAVNFKYFGSNKSNAIPVWALRVEGDWESRISRLSAHEGGKFVTGRLYHPKKYFWNLFLLKAETTHRDWND